MVEIRLTNSKTRRKEVLAPIDPADVRMYVCGPTVYDRAHLGNARPVVVFDVLNRLLRHVYGEGAVTYVRNFTDVDDKINARAARDGRTIREITDETIGWYHEDMKALGALRPTKEPRATEYIEQMVEMIDELGARGHAYAAEGHVLFSVDSYADYGALSGRTVEDMIAGARVEVAPYKRNPMDFVLWKPSEPDLPGWDGPMIGGERLGRGRPGWHIECSAMAKALLDDKFDIHAGGIDLTFPHHENEIAQSCCANGTEEMARFWLHNEMLQVEGKKMSKSLGNFFTVRDLLDQGVPGEVIRFVFLGTHYRKPMDWTEKKRDEAEATLRGWREVTAGATPEPNPHSDVMTCLADDLNTSGAIASLHRQYANVRKGALRPGRFLWSAQLLGLLTPDLGGWDATASVDLTTYSDALAAARAEAMASKDFSRVDTLKTALTAAGVEVRMSKEGIELIPGPDFDADKLEFVS
ncbi:MAG: cysteine--tRNA ligase [Pseudooceanicola sp.]|nr:cysteine--tRNA ligase [Pseudooceanicola sp.]